MIERFADILGDLSPGEIEEFVSPAPGEIKLSAEEVRQALEHMPKKRSLNKAKEERVRLLGQALIAKREMALVDSFVRIALGPEPTNEQREAMRAALGHMYRLGGMFMKTHQANPMYAAAAVASARDARWSNKGSRDEIIDSELLAGPDEAPKRLLPKINAKLQRSGLTKASLSHVYERKKILGQPDEES